MAEASPALPPALAERVAAHWARRAESEARAALPFAAFVAVVPAGLRALTERAAADEERHARACHALAQRYAGWALPAPVPAPWEAPRFGDAPPELSLPLALVLQCCFSETIAAAYLEASLAAPPVEPVRGVLRAMLADEVHHARLGWAFLAAPTTPPRTLAAVAAALPTLRRLARAAWVEAAPELDLDLPEHGCLGHARVTALVDAALEELVDPGFAALGLGRRG